MRKRKAVLDAYRRYFRAEVRGGELLPESPMLLVGNHSGGLYSPEVYVLLWWWVNTFGPERPLYMLAHDLLFAVPGFGPDLRRAGGIPANRDNARRALDEGAAVLVYPGGDHEAFRPWWHRGVIDFNQRKGFMRLALEADVPVVPLVTHGSHDSSFVLTRGNRLAKRLGLGRLRSEIFPFVLGLPWGIAPGFLPTLPLPSRVTMQILEPFHWHADPQDPQAVDDCFDELVGAMQVNLSAQVRERPFPLLR